MTRLFFACAACLLAVTPQSSIADSPPNNADFVVRIQLDALRETNLGAKLITAVKTLAAEEFGNEKSPEDAFEDVEKALGFDPFDELRSINIIGHDIEDPFEGIQVVIGMGNTTGNLEGLLLALPGYQSSEHGDHLIHSVSPDDDIRIFGAIHGGRKKQIVIATTIGDTKSMLDTLDDSGSTSPSDIDSAKFGKSDSIVDVRVNKIPDMDDLDGPPKTIARLIKQIVVNIKEERGALNVTLRLTAADEKRAEQLQQLAQGVVAMVSLMRDSDDADEDLKMVADIVDGLKVERDGELVELNLDLPEEQLIEFLRDEADLPIPK